jgi:HEPN domain-containing protein
MPNRTYALEWLEYSKRNIQAAEILFRENHYTDVIAVELHQGVEKALKSLLALNGVKIPKTHDLLVLVDLISKSIDFDTKWNDDLLIITDYYQTERYPGPRYELPDRDEVEHSLDVATEIFRYVDGIISRNSQN